MPIRAHLPALLIIAVCTGCHRAQPAATGAMANADSGEKAATRLLGPGPWGTVRARDLVVEPGPLQIDGVCGETAAKSPMWHFAGFTRDRLKLLFAAAGLAPEIVNSLVTVAHCDAAQGCLVAPSLALLANLSPHARELIYGTLVDNPEDSGLLMPFHRRVGDDALWEGPGVTPRVASMLRDFSWKSGDTQVFADLPLLCNAIPDGAERTAAVKALLRARSVALELHVSASDDLSGLARWWGAGGREFEVRPMLESAARVPGGVWIEVSHLLPSLPRANLFTFPDPVDPLHDCHFAALNFFRAVPDERLADPNNVGHVLASEYAKVDLKAARFGDVFLFVRREGEFLRYVHSAVYLADDVLYSKNGRSRRVAYSLVRLAELRAIYHSATEVVVLRRRDPSK